MTYTISQVADRYGVGTHTVLAWIRSGELRAVQCGRRIDSRKPRWRITAEAIKEFELLRSAAPPQPRTRRRKRQDPRPCLY